MEIRRDIGYGLSALMVAGVAIAFVSIGLFSRMKPALERIREENVVTLDAAREILLVFTNRGGEALDSAERGRVERALTLMRNNLTVDDEGAMVAAVTDGVARALTGDRAGLGDVAHAIETLSRANTAAMERADAEAQRLGEAGAWTAAIGGLMLVLIGLYTRNRLERRLVRPVVELARVLESMRKGDERARCKNLRGAVELERALKQTNRLLDRLTHEGKGSGGADPRLGEQAMALAWLLDQREGPWALISGAHGIVAANDAAHERLAAEDGSALLARFMIGARERKGEGLTFVGQTDLALCRLPDRAEPPAAHVATGAPR